MKGKYNVVLYDNKVRYELELERNITVIKGKSGTGKSSLYLMFYDLIRNKRNVGIHCNCKDKIAVLDESSDWKSIISNSSNKIFIADEFFEDVTTREFSEVAKNSGNYFIIITRSGRMKFKLDCMFELSTVNKNNLSLISLKRID